MRGLKFLMAGGVCLLALTACFGQAVPNHSAHAPQNVQKHAPDNYGERLQTRIIDNTGTPVGNVAVWQTTNGLVLSIEATGLPMGGHGMHLHKVGSCHDIQSFKASGGHIENIEDNPHGYMHPGGMHIGDMPNLYASDKGWARADIFMPNMNMKELRDHDGSALVIHAQEDDYQTQTIGNSGARIACAAFTTISN